MKILKSILNWLNSNCDFLCLLCVIGMSVWPFFKMNHSEAFFTFFGGFFAFWSVLFLKLNAKIGLPVSKLYTITIGIIAIIGFLSFMAMMGLQDKEIDMPIEYFGLTYVGAVGGILLGGMIFLNNTKN